MFAQFDLDLAQLTTRLAQLLPQEDAGWVQWVLFAAAIYFPLRVAWIWRGVATWPASAVWQAVSHPFRGEPQDPLIARILSDLASPDATWDAGTSELKGGDVELKLGTSWRTGQGHPSDLTHLWLGRAEALADLPMEERLVIAQAAKARALELEAQARLDKRASHLARLEGGSAPVKEIAGKAPPLRGGLNSTPKKVG